MSRFSPEDEIYMAATLFGEARGECIEGIIGVANVIVNRANASKVSIKEICLAPKQFSCWNESDQNFSGVRSLVSRLEAGDEIADPYIRQCIAVARCVCNEDFLDNTLHAKNYVTIQRYQLAKTRNSSVDSWILDMKPTVTIGRHIFLVENERSKSKKA